MDEEAILGQLVNFVSEIVPVVSYDRRRADTGIADCVLMKRCPNGSNRYPELEALTTLCLPVPVCNAATGKLAAS